MMNGRFMPHLQPRALVYLAPRMESVRIRRMVTAPIRMICDWGGPNPARLHKAWLYERAITSLVLQLTSAPVVRSGDRILTRGRANDDSSYAHTATCQKSAHQVDITWPLIHEELVFSRKHSTTGHISRSIRNKTKAPVHIFHPSKQVVCPLFSSPVAEKARLEELSRFKYMPRRPAA
jgi:hypothetical protein